MEILSSSIKRFTKAYRLLFSISSMHAKFLAVFSLLALVILGWLLIPPPPKAQAQTPTQAECMGPALAQYMNSLCAANLSGIHLLTPAFNGTSYTFNGFVQAMRDSGADFSCVEGVAVNIYNTGGQRITTYLNNVKAAFPGMPIYITETGMIEIVTDGVSRSTALSNLTQEIASLRSDGQVAAALLFDSFASNPDSNFSYNFMSDTEIQQVCGGSCSPKVGINSAAGYQQSASFYDRASALGMRFTLEIASASGIDAAAGGINAALARNMTPIMRIGVGTNSGGFADVNAFISFLRTVRSRTSGDFYVIAGPNEPDAECWIDPACCNLPPEPPPPPGGGLPNPDCLCPGQTCCPPDVTPIPPLTASPTCQIEPSCPDPVELRCYFPVTDQNGLPYEQCPWRSEDNDCNPFMWTPTVFQPFAPSTVCPLSAYEQQAISNPPSCTYQVPAQNYVRTGIEVCNNPTVRDVCSRSSGPMSSTPCEGTSQVAYIRKLNQCCDPTANVWNGIGICSSTETPDSRCSACNSWDGTRCVDGTTDVCRKAIQVESFETRMRTTNPPTGAMCAACIERKTTGQDVGCGGVCTWTTCDSCTDPATGLPITDCNLCGETEHEGCHTYSCSSSGTGANAMPYIEGGCNEGAKYNCPAGGDSCFQTGTCCKIQNEVSDATSCSNPPGGCTDGSGSPICPGGCLTGWTAGTGGGAATPVCAAPVSTSCGTCCGGEQSCSRGTDVAQDRYFPPEATNCALYESFTRTNLYTVIYTSNMVTLQYRVSNLSEHNVWDGRLRLVIPDFLDYYSSSANPNIAQPSLWCSNRPTGSNPDGSLTLDEYRAAGCHGGIVTWVISDPALQSTLGRNYFPGAGTPNSEFTITINLVPSDIDSGGGSHYSDHPITLAEVSHYTNNLISDDRLANIEMQGLWPQSDPSNPATIIVPHSFDEAVNLHNTVTSRVSEITAFWIGKGVLSNAGPTCNGTNTCNVDPDANPFGWPVTGKILEDWGGANDIALAPNVTWSDPYAVENVINAATGQLRINIPYGQSDNGEYIQGCGDNDNQGGWKHAGISLIPKDGEANPPYVYSTMAGYVTYVGYNSLYPGRGYYVELSSSIDDDCQYNYVTRYGNMVEDSVRVSKGQYVPRHKLLGIMGDTGDAGQLRGLTNRTGITHTLYQIRYPHATLGDTPDNNMPGGPDPNVDPVSILSAAYNPNYQEPDEVTAVSSLDSDTCIDNPYICNTLTSLNFGVCEVGDAASFFFCMNRRLPDTANRCFFANP